MELRPRSGVSGSRVIPRATSLGRKSADVNKVVDVANETLVNPPSSATGGYQGREVFFPNPPRRGRSDQDLHSSAPQWECGRSRQVARRGPAPSPRANPGRRRRGRESYARSTTSSSRSDSREPNRTPRRRCRIYTYHATTGVPTKNYGRQTYALIILWKAVGNFL